jgi:hypothetical protein
LLHFMVEASMDRYDELKDNRSVDDSHTDERATVDSGILGLGGSPVPKAPGDPTTEYDEESVHQRRARALGDDEVRRPSDDQHGATGIDMGAGGHGTDIAPE